jgi:hypothetical protein
MSLNSEGDVVTPVRRALTVLVAPFVVSCAGSTGGYATALDGYSVSYRTDLEGVRYSFEASADQVVETLPLVYEQLGFEGSPASSPDQLLVISPTLRAETRIYENERNSEYLDCGQGMTGPRADSYLLEFVLVTEVDALETGGSEIEVIVDGFAYDRYNRSDRVSCRGTGRFAGQIAAVLRRMLPR